MAEYNKWYGPYPLTKDSIDKNVLARPLGNYRLSLTQYNTNPTVAYVGRAHDQPVHDRLQDHLTDKLKRCKSFWVMYKHTAYETYCQECNDYHKYNPPLNEYHPAKLPGKDVKCPVKGCDK